MASRLAETRQEITDNTERVRALVREGNREAAHEIASATERLLKSIRTKAERDRLADDLTDAIAAPTSEVEPTDYTAIAGVPELVEETGRAMVKGVRSHREGAEFSRQMARHLLDMRLLIPNHKAGGTPDLHARTRDAKDAAAAAYSKAGRLYMEESPDEDHEATADAVESMMRSVQSQMSDVLVGFLRSLDEDRELAAKYFPAALEASPELSPTEAVYAFYDELGQALPRQGYFEKRRLKRALERARRDGDERRVSELEAELGEPRQRPELSSEETLSLAVTQLRKELVWTDNALAALPGVSDEKVRLEVRKAAEELADKARSLVAATME